MARDTLQGTLDLLVLKTLARGPEHGYAASPATFWLRRIIGSA